MNCKTIVRKENIKKVADFLKEACDYFKKDQEGCWNFDLDENFVVSVGWSDGYDMTDTDIIKSKGGQIQYQNGRVCGYAVNAGVKIRNDYDCSDYDFMNMPIWNDESGEVWITDVTMKPNMKTNDYKRCARWFLQSYVAMTNALKHGKIKIDF